MMTAAVIPQGQSLVRDRIELKRLFWRSRLALRLAGTTGLRLPARPRAITDYIDRYGCFTKQSQFFIVLSPIAASANGDPLAVYLPEGALLPAVSDLGGFLIGAESIAIDHVIHDRVERSVGGA